MAPQHALVGALYAAVLTGSFYGFSIYSAALGQQFNLTQPQLDDVNTIPYAFGIASPVFGIIRGRIGQPATLALGGATISSMQLLLYLIGSKSLALPPSLDPHSALVSVAIVLYLGIAMVACVAFSTPVLHFPRNRGLATAIVKSFVGLGGAAYSQVFVFLWGVPTSDPTALNCLLLWAGGSAIFSAFAVCMIEEPPKAAAAAPTSAIAPASAASAAAGGVCGGWPEPRKLLHVLLVEIGVLGAFSTGLSLLPNGAVHRDLTPLMVVLALLPAPICIFWPRQLAVVPKGGAAAAPPVLLGAREATVEYYTVDGAQQRLLPPPAAREACAPEPAALAALAAPALETETQRDLLQMMATPDAWLFGWAGAAIVGGGTFLATNLSQIRASARADVGLLPTLLTTFSAGNLIGRLLAPLASDALVRRGRPRPLFVTLVAVVMAASQLGFMLGATSAAGSAAQATTLVLSSTFAGLSFGAIWPHLVVLTSELFGSEHLAVTYLFYDGGCGAVGTLVLANFLPRAFYHGDPCVGPGCYGPTHAIIAALNLSGAASSALVAWRAAGLYRRMKKM